MRRSLTVLAVLVGLIAPFGVNAHEGHLHNVLGTVTAVDATRLEVQSREGKAVSIVLDAGTKFLRGKAVVAASGIKSGERVAVAYVEREGKKVAREVHLSEKPVDGTGERGERRRP